MSNNNDASAQYEKERFEPNDKIEQARIKNAQIRSSRLKEQAQPPIVDVKKEINNKPKEESNSLFDGVVNVVADVTKGTLEAPKQIVGGFLDATKELAQLMESAIPLGTVGGDDLTEDSFIPSPDKSDTVTGNLIRGVSQFVTGFLPASKGLKALGVGGGIVKAMSAGAIADATVFDPNEARLSNLVEEFPTLKNPITEYLKSSPDDSDAEGRFKNSLEGLALGAISDVFIKSIKVLRAGNAEKLDKKRQNIKDLADLDKLEAEDPETLAKIKERLDVKTDTEQVGVEPKGKGKKKTKKVDPLAEKDPEKFAANINLNRLDTEEGVTDALKETASRIKAQVDQARRGVITHEETQILADKLNLSVDDVLNKEAGTSVNAEEALATRQLHLAAQEKATELSNIAKESGDRIDRLAALKAQQIADKLFEKTSGNVAEAARTLQAQRILAKVKGPQREAIKEIIARGGKASAMVRQGLEDANTPEQIKAVVDLATNPRKRDAAVEYWYNAMLSGFSTHAINVMGNAINTMWNVGTRIITPIIGKGFGDQETTIKEGLEAVFGMVQGMKEGFDMAGRAIKSSDFNLENTTMEIRPGAKKAISAETFGATGVSGKAIDYLGSVIRTPGRFLTAGDAFFRSINYRMELNALAFRRASDEGLTGKDAAKRMKQIIESPPDELIQEARQFSKVQTFTNELNTAGKGLQQAANNFIPLKLLMPFIRTPVNLIKVAARSSVLAPISSAFRADVAAGGARRDRALAQAGMGASLMSVMASMTSEGTLTGGGPSSQGLKTVLKTTGWQPYSIKINDTYYAYNRADPIGTLLAMAADYTEVSGNASDIDTNDLAQTIVLSTMKNLGDKTYLRGINDFFKAYNQVTNDPENEENLVTRWTGNLLSSVVPNIVSSVKKGLDPIARVSDDSSIVNSALDKIRSRTPGFSTELPAVLNIFGDEVFNGGGAWQRALSPIYTSDIKKDAIADELAAIEVPIRMPNKNIKGIKLSPQEYNDFVKITNVLGGDSPTYRDTLQEAFNSSEYKNSTMDLKQEIVKRITFSYRQAAQAIFIENYTEFKLKYEQKLAQRELALLGE